MQRRFRRLAEKSKLKLLARQKEKANAYGRQQVLTGRSNVSASIRPAIRALGFPESIDAPWPIFKHDQRLKAHPQYRAAKSGDHDAAIKLVGDLAGDLGHRAAREVDPAVIFVAPHAREATGDNAIPQALAAFMQIWADASLDTGIVQATKVFHTGADPMERMIARPRFQGAVRRDATYFLVDDVTTMGGTLAELADYIQHHGGLIAGVAVLVNASRSGRMFAHSGTVKQLSRRYGDEIREIFGIETRALTFDEAQYLIGFRSVEEIRGRVAQARQKTALRLRSKGVQPIEKRDELVVSTFRRRSLLTGRLRRNRSGR
jgi:hypothetical protein